LLKAGIEIPKKKEWKIKKEEIIFNFFIFKNKIYYL
jgi:hypothetical protein